MLLLCAVGERVLVVWHKPSAELGMLCVVLSTIWPMLLVLCGVSTSCGGAAPPDSWFCALGCRGPADHVMYMSCVLILQGHSKKASCVPCFTAFGNM